MTCAGVRQAGRTVALNDHPCDRLHRPGQHSALAGAQQHHWAAEMVGGPVDRVGGIGDQTGT